LTSYLLIGFWFEKKIAADAGKKAFITTRTGDLGFIVGILILTTAAGTFNFREMFHAVEAGHIPFGLLTLGAIFLFAGAVG
ncbi:MAG: NADH-quinone oxidoreductase subunit L, partial [Deltaproteobacteria bacterium]|nr:NADH-quinone oxidoreductase subunit L [Deltaproteobacteria bacterium]